MIRLMRRSDFEGLMRLKATAGWNQTPLDWERMLRLEPTGCFVEERDGTPVGTTTVLRHGPDLAWIGMVVVLPEFRRRGVARGLMRHALEWLERSHRGAVGLDATDMGRPLYEQLAFKGEEIVERWDRPPLKVPSAPEVPASRSVFEAILAKDRDTCGYDRSALLLDFAADPSVETVASSRGFAFGRPGSSAWQIGPCVAESANDAESIVGDLLSPHGSRSVFWDLMPSNRSAPDVARRLGFRPARRLTRMYLDTRGPAPASVRPDRTYAIAGLEFG